LLAFLTLSGTYRKSDTRYSDTRYSDTRYPNPIPNPNPIVSVASVGKAGVGKVGAPRRYQRV